MALTIKEAVRKWGTEYLTICGIANYFPTMNFNSHVFFVDGNSAVGNDGVNTLGQVPDEPFLTITHALSLCTSGDNDYIFVLDYPSTAPEETWPIVISKQRVHIIGVRNGILPTFKIVAPGDTVDTPVFAFGAAGGTYGAYCEIANLIMGSEKSDSIRGAIESHYGGAWGNHIHHCHFGPEGRSNTGASYGIVAGRSSNTYAAGEMLYGLIEKCTFGKALIEAGIFVGSGLTDSGPNAIYGLVIRDNIFYVNSGDVGIHINKATANFRNGGIYNNRFILAADDTGDAITLAAGVTGGMIDGNIAGVLANFASMANNPYLTNTACGPAWGRNWKGGSDLVIRPALA